MMCFACKRKNLLKINVILQIYAKSRIKQLPSKITITLKVYVTGVEMETLQTNALNVLTVYQIHQKFVICKTFRYPTSAIFNLQNNSTYQCKATVQKSSPQHKKKSSYSIFTFLTFYKQQTVNFKFCLYQTSLKNP